MKRITLPFLFLLFLCAGCKEKDRQSSGKPENSVDAARDFIRSALDGKFREAREFLLNDSVNTNYMDVAERSYHKSSQDVRDGYRTSTIRIHKTDPVNDSTAIIVFSNSYKNDHDTLRLLKVNQEWLVDLKYLYEHDQDTLYGKPVFRDSLP
jgi:hypothetical protein